jgi:hypothetical protein
MKWIKSNTGQSMFALWLASLVCLVVMHKLQPDDPWNQMLSQPAFLIFAPLLVACIPLLATKPSPGEDDGRWNLRPKPKWINSDTVRRVLLVWLISLVVFASPHGVWASYLNPVMHQPLFLLIAPLMLACIPLLAPWPIPIRSEVVQTGPPLSRSRVWSGIAACLMLIVILIGMLVLINEQPSRQNSMSVLWPNLFFGGGIIAFVLRFWYFVKILKTAR